MYFTSVTPNPPETATCIAEQVVLFPSLSLLGFVRSLLFHRDIKIQGEYESVPAWTTDYKKISLASISFHF